MTNFVAAIYLHMAVAYHHVGRLEESAEMAEKLDALDSPYENLFLVMLYALQGDLDTAFEWLEKASEEFPRYIVEDQPYFSILKSDPRWETVLQQFESRYERSDQ